MALQYFIDGYNLIWSTEQFGHGTLREQRESLLRFLEETRPAGSPRNQVIVVFDGKEDVESPLWKGSVWVVFSSRTDADGVIKEMVDNLPNPRIAVVVTDDRDIQKWVRASKAKFLSCKEFLQKALRKPKSPLNSEKPSPEEAQFLNKELLRIWKLD